MDALRPFQTRFIRSALAAGTDTAVLSLPRGNGKSWLAARLAIRVLTPGDELFRAGMESVLLAASIEQARICFKVRQDRAGTDWRVSLSRLGNPDRNYSQGHKYPFAGDFFQRKIGDGPCQYAGCNC